MTDTSEHDTDTQGIDTHDADEDGTMTLEATASTIPTGTAVVDTAATGTVAADGTASGTAAAGTVVSSTVASDAAGADAAETASATRPRIRSGAIAWGLIVCGFAIAVLLIVGSPASRTDFAAWLGGLTPGGFVLIAVLAFGGLILLWGLLGLIRRLQRSHRLP